MNTAPPRATRPSRTHSAKRHREGLSYALIGTVPPPTNSTPSPAHTKIRRHPQCPETAPHVGFPSAAQHHVLLCWLALLLIRVIETRTGQTWHHVRRDLDRLHAVTFTGPTGMFRQRTELSKPQRDLLARLDIPAPKQIIELTTTSR